MARQNIFELLAERNDNGRNAKRIHQLFNDWYFVKRGAVDYSLKDFVETNCFDNWKQKGKCLTMDDFFETLDYNSMLKKSGDYLNHFLNLIEVVYNFWYLAENYFKKTKKGIWVRYSTIDELKKLMDECLEENGFEPFYCEEDEKLLVIESNPEAIAVAEIVEPDLAIEIIRYNHHLLKGNLRQKKSILLSMSNDLEPKRKALHALNSTLEDNIFYLANNLNIRHNNCEEGKNYKQAVAEMNSEEIESWYDEAYQSMLLAYLLLDNEERNKKVKDLKQLIN